MRLSARGVTGDASFYVRARGVFRSVRFGSVPFVLFCTHWFPYDPVRVVNADP
jgi:hypothetical protein